MMPKSRSYEQELMGYLQDPEWAVAYLNADRVGFDHWDWVGQSPQQEAPADHTLQVEPDIRQKK